MSQSVENLTPAPPELNEIIKTQEIERRFLVPEHKLPDDFLMWQQKNIEHGYLSRRDAPYELRVTTVNDHSAATLKTAEQLQRIELEVPLDSNLVENYINSARRRISKQRYVSPGGYELDIFSGNLLGLAIVEIEFESARGAAEFEPPEWFGDEVTYERSFYNSQLTLDTGYQERIGFSPEQVWQRIHHRQATNSGPFVVGIAGSSGSGKTTMANQLQAAFGQRATLLSVDNWHRGKTALEAMNGGQPWTNWDLPIVYNTAEMATHLSRLKRGESVIAREFDFNCAELVETGVIEPNDVLIVEGLYALDKRLRPLLDCSVFIDVDQAERIVRRIRRDVSRTPWPVESIFSYMMNVAEPTCMKHVEPQKLDAEFIVSNM